MVLIPKNNWISVDLIKDKKEESDSSILLPHDYRPQENPHSVAVVAVDAHSYKAGAFIVVPTHMIREIEIEGIKSYLVERNHIMAEVESWGTPSAGGKRDD